MAVALPFILVGLTALSTVMSMQGAKADAKAAAQAADYNAQINERNAAVTRQQTAHDIETQRRQDRRTRGKAVAAYGKSGITLEGSPLDVLEDMATEQELGIQTAKYNGELRAMGYEDTAALDRMSGGQALARGDRQASSILVGGLARGAGQAYGTGLLGGGSTPSSSNRGGSSYPGSKY